MPRRASKWTLHETKSGRWDLSKGGRYYYTGLSSEAEALRRLRNHFVKGEEVFLEEVDGYRTNVTKKLQSKGIV